MLSLERALPSSKEGMPPSPQLNDYFVCILQKCKKEGCLAQTLRLHAYMLQTGLNSHASLGNYLVSILVEVGSMCHAQQVFDKLVYPDEHSWNLLITAYVERGKSQRALTLYQKMLEHDLLHPPFVPLLKACTDLQDLKSGQELHVEIIRKGLLERDVFVGSTLVDMYAKCGSLVKAQEVLDKLQVRNVVSWTALIAGYAEHGQVQEALNCTEQMQSEGIFPDAFTLVCILKACGSIAATDKGREMHIEIAKKGLLESNAFVGSTLVYMYAKFGFLVEAQEVFQNLPVRNVVSWTALISGYAEHGRGEEALYYFEQMKHGGFFLNAVTFVCSLKACGIIQAIDKGREIHADIAKKGLERELLIGNTLVDLYAKCGLLATAQEVFDKLPVRTVVSWNALVTGYAEHGHGEEALHCYEQMQHDGISLTVVTFVCSLKACSSIGATRKGQEIHAEIVTKGLERELLIGSTLVDMYAKCGLLATTQEVFDMLPVRDVVSWNALFTGYLEYGCGEEALYCFEMMQHEGIFLNAVTFACSLKACGSIGAIVKGREIHAEIAKKGLERELLIGNTLIDMYAKCGSLETAQEVFDKLGVRDMVSWNALITGYGECGCAEKAFYCLKQMQQEGVSPGSITFVCSLKACSSIRDTVKGQEVHDEIVKKGLERELLASSTLVDMYAKCGSLVEAHEVFDKLPDRTIVSWNALIAGYTEHGHGEEALNCIEQMQKEGTTLDAATLVCGLKACGRIGATDQGREMHAEVSRKGLERELFVGNILVDMYAKCGLLVEAQDVFDKLSVQDVVAWTAVIAGYIERGHSEEALHGFELMQQKNISLNAATFVCGLKACGSIGATVKGAELHTEISRQGLEKDVLVGNILVDMYAKCGMLAEAQEVFDKLPVQDAVSWNALIAGYAQLGESENVFHSFAKMIGEGIKPDLVTFVSVLNACNHAGLVDKGQMYFEAISIDYGFIPTLEHYTCIVDLLGRAGHIDKVVAMIKKMPLHPDVAVWHTLLGACQKRGNVDLGRHAFKHAVRLDEKYVAAYVCMSNMYAHAGGSEQG